MMIRCPICADVHHENDFCAPASGRQRPRSSEERYASLGRACEANGLGWYDEAGEMRFQPPADVIREAALAYALARSAQPQLLAACVAMIEAEDALLEELRAEGKLPDLTGKPWTLVDDMRLAVAMALSATTASPTERPDPPRETHQDGLPTTQSEWRGMESAPRDGTEILASTTGAVWFQCSWDEEDQCWVTFNRYLEDDRHPKLSTPAPRVFKPTLWSALPEAPR